jgi:hypothetical protein
MALPGAPVFLLQQTHHHRAALPGVGLARAADGGTAPGILLSYDDVHERGVEDAARSCAPLAPLLADPGGHRPGRLTINGIDTASWIGRPAPSTPAEWDQTASEATSAQRALGVDAIIIPTVELESTGWPNGLQGAVDAARRSVLRDRRTGDPEWMVRLCLRDDWILDPTRRRTLLNQVTDLPDDLGVALHVRWARRDIIARDDHLDAVAQTVAALARDDRKVMLCEAGLIGWLAIAWGAWGFTAGTSQSSWHDSTQRMGRQPGVPAPPPVEYYFEPALLTRLRRLAHQQICGRSGYAVCACAFCQQLQPDAGGAWSALLSMQHALYSLQALTERANAPTPTDRRTRVREAVVAAQAQAGHLGMTVPAHLAVWLTHL